MYEPIFFSLFCLGKNWNASWIRLLKKEKYLKKSLYEFKVAGAGNVGILMFELVLVVGLDAVFIKSMSKLYFASLITLFLAYIFFSFSIVLKMYFELSRDLTKRVIAKDFFCRSQRVLITSYVCSIFHDPAFEKGRDLFYFHPTFRFEVDKHREIHKMSFPFFQIALIIITTFRFFTVKLLE